MFCFSLVGKLVSGGCRPKWDGSPFLKEGKALRYTCTTKPNLDRLGSEDILYNYFYGAQHIRGMVIKVLSIRMNDKV